MSTNSCGVYSPLPIEVVAWIAVTSPTSMRFSLWTMLCVRQHLKQSQQSATYLERLMAIAYVLEEMYLVFASEKSGPNRMHRSITPSLVVEASGLVEMLEELHVLLRPPEVQIPFQESAETPLKHGAGTDRSRSSTRLYHCRKRTAMTPVA